MELIIGPALALIGSIFFTVASAKKTVNRIDDIETSSRQQIVLLEDKVAMLESKMIDITQNTEIKFAQTLAPVAQAVKALNEQVGI